MIACKVKDRKSTHSRAKNFCLKFAIPIFYKQKLFWWTDVVRVIQIRSKREGFYEGYCSSAGGAV